MDQTLTSARQSVPAAPSLELSVVMPCYNESEGIDALLRDWDRALADRISKFEIIVINDGSTDGTGRVLDRIRKEIKTLRVIHQLNSGHGKSIRRGYGLARGKYVLQVDPSGCYDVTDFLRLWEQRDAAMVMAVRTRRIDSLLRQAFAYLLRGLTNFTFGIHLTDPDVPFRLYKWDSLQRNLNSLEGADESLNLLLAARIAREQPRQVKEVLVPFRMRKVRRLNGETLRSIFRFGAMCRDVLRYRLIRTRRPVGHRVGRPILAGT